MKNRTKFKNSMVSLMLVCFLAGCASTSDLREDLEETSALVDEINVGTVAVTLIEGVEKYERFRSTLETTMKDRYVHSGSEITFDKVEFLIDQVHFDHKGASFATGGASGGNWVQGHLIITVDGETTEIPVEERFNTGGGYTVFQDWEARMIIALIKIFDYEFLDIFL